ncbi:MAG TPA: hypothetical protein VLS94_03200 [Fusibacter sp.]|nr:hypothetical protein [Fusibacter sp.]
MRKLMNAEIMEHDFKLRQMGADVYVVNSKMCYVLFMVGKHEISYVYNINTKGRYFLERIKPYPLALREFESEADVIEIIEIDLEQFKNASHSHNIDAFIDINKRFNLSLRKFEDLFLYFNVPLETAEHIQEELDRIDALIEETKVTANRLYFKKNPDNL